MEIEYAVSGVRLHRVSSFIWLFQATTITAHSFTAHHRKNGNRKDTDSLCHGKQLRLLLLSTINHFTVCVAVHTTTDRSSGHSLAAARINPIFAF